MTLVATAPERSGAAFFACRWRSRHDRNMRPAVRQPPARALVKMARRGALLGGAGAAKRAEHAVQRGIADAEPVLLADEMMAQVVLLDPAAQPRMRLVRNVVDVMPVSYTHLRAHETGRNLVCRLL